MHLRAACTCLEGTRVGKKDPVLQILEICAVIGAYDDRVARWWAATVVAPSLLLQAPPHLVALTSRRFKGLG